MVTTAELVVPASRETLPLLDSVMAALVGMAVTITLNEVLEVILPVLSTPFTVRV
jgi:hypothetical protein